MPKTTRAKCLEAAQKRPDRAPASATINKIGEFMSYPAKLYNATIVIDNMYVSEIDTSINYADVIDAYDSARVGHTVLISSDFDQLEAMAKQMGLAFCPEAV